MKVMRFFFILIAIVSMSVMAFAENTGKKAEEKSMAGGRLVSGVISSLDFDSGTIQLKEIEQSTKPGEEKRSDVSTSFTLTEQTRLSSGGETSDDDAATSSLALVDFKPGDRVRLEVDEQNRVLSVTLLDDQTK